MNVGACAAGVANYRQNRVRRGCYRLHIVAVEHFDGRDRLQRIQIVDIQVLRVVAANQKILLVESNGHSHRCVTGAKGCDLGVVLGIGFNQ